MSGRHRRERLPLYVQDQMAAAEQEASSALRQTAQAFGAQMYERQHGDPDDPVLNRIIQELQEMADAHSFKHCRHVLLTPQPIMLNMWDRPLTLRCVPCHRALPPLSRLQDSTCDACGRVDPSGTWPSQIALGAIVVSMGRCDTCVPEHIKNAEHGR